MFGIFFNNNNDLRKNLNRLWVLQDILYGKVYPCIGYNTSSVIVNQLKK